MGLHHAALLFLCNPISMVNPMTHKKKLVSPIAHVFQSTPKGKAGPKNQANYRANYGVSAQLRIPPGWAEPGTFPNTAAAWWPMIRISFFRVPGIEREVPLISSSIIYLFHPSEGRRPHSEHVEATPERTWLKQKTSITGPCASLRVCESVQISTLEELGGKDTHQATNLLHRLVVVVVVGFISFLIPFDLTCSVPENHSRLR